MSRRLPGKTAFVTGHRMSNFPPQYRAAMPGDAAGIAVQPGGDDAHDASRQLVIADGDCQNAHVQQ